MMLNSVEAIVEMGNLRKAEQIQFESAGY